MSHQRYEDFAKKLQDDAAIQQELQAIYGSPAEGIAAKDLADFAAGKGYQFHVDEVPGELSERELEGASGGGDIYRVELVNTNGDKIAGKLPPSGIKRKP